MLGFPSKPADAAHPGSDVDDDGRASANAIPFPGSSTSKTRPSASATRVFGIASFRAAASTRSSRARSAAWSAALPVIKVTREE